MTPGEITHLTGYSRRAIDEWVRKESWQTSPRPGVQGDKARLVHISKRVKEFTRSAQHVAETPGAYSTRDGDLESLLPTLSKELTPSGQKRLMSLLLRGGITGSLPRLGIRSR